MMFNYDSFAKLRIFRNKAIASRLNIVNACLSTLMPDTWYNYRSYDLMELMGTAYLLYLMLGTIVELAAYHVITERILSSKLNLE